MQSAELIQERLVGRLQNLGHLETLETGLTSALGNVWSIRVKLDSQNNVYLLYQDSHSRSHHHHFLDRETDLGCRNLAAEHSPDCTTSHTQNIAG